MDVWEINKNGEIVNRIKDKTQDAFHMVQQVDGAYQRIEGQSITFKVGTIESQTAYTYSSDGETISSYDVYNVRGDDNGTALFNFMGDNVTGVSGVEVSQAMTGIAGDKGLNFITTSHTPRVEKGMGYLLTGQLQHGYTIREINHTHHNILSPSNVDVNSATIISNAYRRAGENTPKFHIYVPRMPKIPF